MARKMIEKAKVLDLLKEVLVENYGKDVKTVRGNLNYYYAGYGEMDDDFTSREKVVANMMTKKQWQKALDSITDEELASCMPVEAVEVETIESVETVEAIEVETEESKEVKKACQLLQGYLDDQGDGVDIVPDCNTWEEFRIACAEFFLSPDYFIENYIKVNL